MIGKKSQFGFRYFILSLMLLCLFSICFADAENSGSLVGKKCIICGGLTVFLLIIFSVSMLILHLRIKNRTIQLNKKNKELENEIREKQNLADKFKETQILYSSTMDAIDEAIHMVDTNLKILLHNETFTAWCKEFRLSPDIKDKTIFEVFPFLSEKVRDEYNLVIKTGKSLFTEEFIMFGGKEVHTETKK